MSDERPKGSLELAIDLFDDAFTLAHNAIADVGPGNEHYNRYADTLDDLRRRRAALQPRLAPSLSSECRCRMIQTVDPRRHFQGCPLRKELDR